MSDLFDGIILGTGHNALILQAYLARCGLKTLSVDRASTPGGGLMTIENPRLPGFRHNPHSFLHRAVTAMLSDGKLVKEFKNVHSDAVFALDFTPDGKYLASGAADKFARVVE